MPFQFFPQTPPVVDERLYNAIANLGLTTGLKLCLDAGDAASYPSGQKWLDRSGNGYDFFLGTNNSATSADPTFNGTAGAASSAEYWSIDSGDCFRYDTTNETWMENLHKAGAKYTVVLYARPLASGSEYALGSIGASGTGFALLLSSSGALSVFALNAGSNVTNTTVAANTPLSGKNNFYGGSVDVGAGQYWGQANSLKQSGSITYTSPSSSSASFTMEIGSRGNLVKNGSETQGIAGLAIWEGVTLSAAQISAIFEATRARQGL